MFNVLYPKMQNECKVNISVYFSLYLICKTALLPHGCFIKDYFLVC